MVQTPILASTLLLTILSFIGLVFFIRASVKDRTTILQCPIEASQSDRLNELQTYFSQRAYQIKQINPQQQTLSLEGYVRPSGFLAIFLTLMTLLGLGCASLVLSSLNPEWGQNPFFLMLLSPLAGIFYWQKAGRLETISIAVNTNDGSGSNQYLSIRAHRDELQQLKQHFAWQWLGQEEH